MYLLCIKSTLKFKENEKKKTLQNTKSNYIFTSDNPPNVY